MSERLKDSKETKKKRETKTERGARFYRNFNMFVGGVALGGAAIAAPVLAAPLGVYAGLNFLQAGGSEVVRRYAKKRRVRKEKDQKKE